jgi:hypothetical protein
MASTQPSINQISGLTSALNLKANLASSALTGTPTAPTASSATSTNQIATTAFVHAVVGAGGTISLTTTGNSGAAGLVSNVLNVPNYTLVGLLPALTTGSVIYYNGTTLAQDSTNFFWDGTTHKLGIGTTTPGAMLHVNGSAKVQNLTINALGNGVLKVTTGIVGVAIAGTDYQAPITVTTTGSSGPATLISNVLNIPQYSGGGGGSYLAGAGLTLTGSTFSVNTIQAITRLSNLTSNGLVKTTTANGTLVVATAGVDYQTPIVLTTTSNSGAATFIGSTLNIPNYTLVGLGGISASSSDTLTNKNLVSGTNTFPTFNQSTTGNAATATKLATARSINGVAFDGTANVTIATAATVSTVDNSTNIATTAYVQNALAANAYYFAPNTFTGPGTLASPFTLSPVFVGTHGQATLVSGQKAVTVTGTSTSSVAVCSSATQAGAGSTVRYIAVCTANTVTVQAYNSGGTINTSDTSVVNYIVYP